LLDSGADPNLKDDKGQTALDMAIKDGRHEGTEILKRLKSGDFRKT
jgi:ankyrin repeat protein